MIDAVSISIPSITAPVDDLENIRPTVSGYAGTIRNLRFNCSDNGAFVRGSLAKFAHGENATPLTQDSICSALAELEQILQAPLRNAPLRSLEVGYTFPVSRLPSDYILPWGELPRFKKHIYGKHETVTFAQKEKSFTAYDKGREMAPEALPERFGGRAALRMELEVKKGVKRFCGREVAVWDLADKEFYKFLVNCWSETYFRIPKAGIPDVIIPGMTPKEWRDALAAIALKSLGSNLTEGLIQSAYLRGDISRSTASRMRGINRDLLGQKEYITTDPLTEELDEMVREVTLAAP